MPGLTARKAAIDGAGRAMDFIGLSDSARAHLRFITKPPFVRFEFLDTLPRGLTDIGWEWWPEGLGCLLRQLDARRR
jgi:beta-glucosidase